MRHTFMIPLTLAIMLFSVAVQGDGCCCCVGSCVYAGSPPCPCPAPPPGKQPPRCPLATVLDLYRVKYTSLLPKPGDGRNASTFHASKTGLQSVNGESKLIWSGTSGWTSGFYPGLLWQLYNATAQRDESLAALYEEGAITATASLEYLKTDTSTHDVGFMIFGSFGNGLELGGKSKYVNVITTAAHSLAQRWSPTVGMIRSWGAISDSSKFEVIIDNLMNLELLFWSAQKTGNSTLGMIAKAHAMKTGKLWLREDNSTAHLCTFDPITGKLEEACTGTPQGYSAGSTWARGQAWGIYGWTMAYRFTRDESFLTFAERAASYYILNTDHKTRVPLWDFQAPKNESWPDTSAAAITASALVELSGATGNRAYRDYAQDIVASLTENFVIDPPSTSEAVFYGNRHDACASDSGIQCTIIETEYYTYEAIRRLAATNKI